MSTLEVDDIYVLAAYIILTLGDYSDLLSFIYNTAMVGTGGEVLVSSGISGEGSSGRTSIESSPSGPHGVSGDVLVASGHSEAGTSGMITLQTGSSKTAAGGSLSLHIGDGGGMSNGGDILLTAGLTSAQDKKGGKYKSLSTLSHLYYIANCQHY